MTELEMAVERFEKSLRGDLSGYATDSTGRLTGDGILNRNCDAYVLAKAYIEEQSIVMARKKWYRRP